MFRSLQMKKVDSLVFLRFLHNSFTKSRAEILSFLVGIGISEPIDKCILEDVLRMGRVSGVKSIANIRAKNSNPELARYGIQGFAIIIAPLIGVAMIWAASTTAEKWKNDVAL